MKLINRLTLCVALSVGIAGPSITHSTVSAAADANEAELVRLTAELKKHLSKNQNKGANDAYEAILKLKKVTVPADLHYMGGLASRALGDLIAAMARFEKASAGGHAAAKEEVASIQSRFGQVEIAKQKKENRTLTIDEAPFDPIARAAVDTAAAAVADTGKFEGWLPVGSYKLGSKAFTVTANAKMLKVK
ncbi:MAG: hypothetical protein FJ096_04115 [Deltaproteobacteria bacterium]|nr:hypothetical protein [Deltaproteobacteria bacterium]